MIGNSRAFEVHATDGPQAIQGHSRGNPRGTPRAPQGCSRGPGAGPLQQHRRPELQALRANSKCSAEALECN